MKRAKTIYSHAIYVAFELETEHKHLEDMPLWDLLEAMQKRIDTIRREGSKEPFGIYDTHEVTNEA